MEKESWVQNLLQSIDNMEVETFLTFLADDVLFRFGNADPVNGKVAVGEAVENFFGTVKEMQHDMIRIWSEEDTVICQGTVTYTRHDSTVLSVPFVNILVCENNLIMEYLIFVDVSQLYVSS